MNPLTDKCVVIIDESLNIGVITNAVAILSISIGNKIEGLIGPDVFDKSAVLHVGLTRLPIPVLGASREQIKNLRNNFLMADSDNGLLIDFNQLAQQSRNYDEYTERLNSIDAADIAYLGIALYGNKKFVNSVTKGLQLIGK
jgi:hypothetical protein